MDTSLDDITTASYPELRDARVVVTGAAGGIGFAIATAFARAGASVVLADIREHQAEDGAASLRTQGFSATARAVDIADPDSARALIVASIERLGAVDVLINNAGIDAPPGVAWDLPDDHWRRIVEVNLSGAFWVSKAVISHMIARRSGRIVMISSEAAYKASLVTSAAYNAAKAGLVGLTIGLAKQLEPHGILVNAIAPGPTGTGQPMTEQEIAAANRTYPLGLGGPGPVARACLYLAGRSGDWISGSVLNVSGGRIHG